MGRAGNVGGRKKEGMMGEKKTMMGEGGKSWGGENDKEKEGMMGRRRE